MHRHFAYVGLGRPGRRSRLPHWYFSLSLKLLNRLMNELFVGVAAHFVNWPPQPAKPHILLDNDNVLQPIDDLINGTSSRRPPSGIATAAAGGNATTRVTQLVNALRRLMPRQQTHDSSSSSTSPFLLPQSSVLVRKRRQNDADGGDVDDEAMWSLLLDWVAQEQQEAFVMADEARPPPPPLPFPSLLVESDPGSGDGGKVLKFVQSQVDPNPDDDDDEEEETEPASMAIAESLILLHPLAASAVDPPGRIKTVFAYDHPLVEIVQLDPFETSPPLKSPVTFIDATDHVIAATAVNNSEDDDDDSMTSNETVPPDSRSDSLDVIWRQQGQEEETDLLATGTPPPSSILLSLAGNITEDILSLEPWSDVISYPGTPAPPSLAIEEENSVKSSCECVCPSLSDSPPVTDPTTTTTVATTTEHQLIEETTTIEMPTTILLPSAIEIVPQEEDEKEEQRGCPIVPTCPPPSLLETTTIPTTTATMMTTTTALPIPPILILEGERTEDTHTQSSLPAVSLRGLLFSYSFLLLPSSLSFSLSFTLFPLITPPPPRSMCVNRGCFNHKLMHHHHHHNLLHLLSRFN